MLSDSVVTHPQNSEKMEVDNDDDGNHQLKSQQSFIWYEYDDDDWVVISTKPPESSLVTYKREEINQNLKMDLEPESISGTKNMFISQNYFGNYILGFQKYFFTP